MTLREKPVQSTLDEIRQDPSLMLALGIGSSLTVFLAVAHACCIGLTTPHVANFLQICSSAG
ncbi:MAG: hypothetical protein ABJY83_23405 [Roseibium sp.]